MKNERMKMRSNSKLVKSKMFNHVMDFLDNDNPNKIETLGNDINALVYGNRTIDQAINDYIDGGAFLICYHEQRDFINSLDLNNNSGREFSDQEVFEMYKTLVSRAIVEILK